MDTSVAAERDEHRAWLEAREALLAGLHFQQEGKPAFDPMYVDAIRQWEYHIEEYERLCVLAPEMVR